MPTYPHPASQQACSKLKQHAPHLLLVAQDCLSNGRPLLIENIEEELDPVLDPVLERRVIKQARGYTMQLGDKEVPAQHCSPLSLVLCAANGCTW